MKVLSATIQTGIGAIPNAIPANLGEHRALGIHTELLSDGVIELIESGVVTGARKRNNRTKTVGTFVLGTQRLYDFVADNPAVELWPATYVNDPRRIAGEPNFVSINATVEVDLAGSARRRPSPGRYWSSRRPGGLRARRDVPEGGQAFVVCRSTADEGRISKIVPTFAPGTIVTTLKNTVDKIVTEWASPSCAAPPCASARRHRSRSRTRTTANVSGTRRGVWAIYEILARNSQKRLWSFITICAPVLSGS